MYVHTFADEFSISTPIAIRSLAPHYFYFRDENGRLSVFETSEAVPRGDHEGGGAREIGTRRDQNERAAMPAVDDDVSDDVERVARSRGRPEGHGGKVALIVRAVSRFLRSTDRERTSEAGDGTANEKTGEQGEGSRGDAGSAGAGSAGVGSETEHGEEATGETRRPRRETETADVAAKGKSRTMIEGEEDISWRKYGRKYIRKEAPTPIERSYYRCSVPGCPARKHVCIRSGSDKLEVSYMHDHTCNQLEMLRMNTVKRTPPTRMERMGPPKKRPLQSTCTNDSANNDQGINARRIPRWTMKRKRTKTDAKKVASTQKVTGAKEYRNVGAKKAETNIPQNISLFARVKSKDGETALKPVRLIMPSKGKNDALKSQIALRDAALKVERSKVIALEATLELLRSQIECRNVRERFNGNSNGNCH